MQYNTNPILYRITQFLLYYEVITTEKFYHLMPNYYWLIFMTRTLACIIVGLLM